MRCHVSDAPALTIRRLGRCEKSVSPRLCHFSTMTQQRLWMYVIRKWTCLLRFAPFWPVAIWRRAH